MTIVATGSPLDFNVPPSWPVPAPEWIAAHHGWIPPVGWTPNGREQPAPQGWQFWVRNPERWAAYAKPYRAPAIRSIAWGAGIFGIGLVLTLIGLLPIEVGAIHFFFFGTMIVGIIRIVRGLVILSRVNRSLASMPAGSLPIARPQFPGGPGFSGR